MLTLSPDAKRRLLAEAKAHRSAYRFDAARDALQKLVLAEPTNPEVHYFLSQIAFEGGDRALCLKHLSKAVHFAPQSTKLLSIAADRFAHLGENEAALDAFEQLIKLEPKAVGPRANRARHLQLMGRFDAAEAELRKLIRKHEADPELYRILVGTTKLKKNDPLIRAMETLWKHPRLNDMGRMNIGFALAKAMEDSGQSDRVFPYLRDANLAQQRLAPFDEAALQAEVEGLLRAQRNLDLKPIQHIASVPRPVFVCGMPRSGTTLVEQVLGRHSAVTSGGELGHAYPEATRAFGSADDMADLAGQPDAKLAAWARRYLALVTRDTGAQSGVVTDKSIRTERLFGLIHKALPGAGLIVVRRDPRDVALSIYKNHFAAGTHRYANRLEDIAAVIKLFRQTVAHWKERLPDAIHEIRYEDLVSEPDSRIRELVEMAGLEWEPGCLEGSTQKGTVKTLSLAQVRQPIHAGRREAWRHYEGELQPFLDAWGDEPWD
jgi:tetratricopeptide (TPR) repeat protein